MILLLALLSAWPFGEVRREVLPNGLTVLLSEDASSPLVSVGVMYRVGARNEAAGTTGLAHYAEHMNFRATRGFPGSEITECITRIGGRWNGYTWLDQTYYAETVPKRALDRMLDVERERMSEALHDAEDFAKERTSVLAELRSYDDPRSVLYDAVLAASFEIHPYRNNTIGWPSDVETVTRDEAYRFYKRFYHPDNAVLVVVGDMDAERTLDQIRGRFGPLPGAGESTAVRTLEPPQTGQRRVAVRRPGPHAKLLAAYRAPALADPDFPAMVLFDALLAGGKGFYFTRDYPAPPATPLARALVDSGLASEASSDWQASPYPYVYTLSASVPEAPGLAGAEAALFRLIAESEAREWTDAEIGAARRQVLTGWASDLDDKASRAHQLAFFEVAGDYRRLLNMPEQMAQVTREDLKRFVREHLQPDQATVGRFEPSDALPRETLTPPAPTAPDSPPAGTVATRSASAPAPAVFALASGLRVVLAPNPASTLVALRARVDAGSLHEAGQPGLAALLAESLARSGHHAVGLTLHADPAAARNRRFLELEARGLPDDLPRLVGDLRRRLEEAARPVEGWEALRSAAAQRAREHASGAETALYEKALSAFFPAGSTASRPPWGSVAAIEALSSAQLEAFARRSVVPGRVSLAIAGAFDPATARSALQSAFGDWRGATAPASPSVHAKGPPAWTESVLMQPRAQNELMVAWPGDRSKPHDRAATSALLYLLGETGYAGRLGRSLVDPGLVYWVQATLEEEGAPGFLMIRTAASAQDTKETLARIRTILTGAAKGDFTQAELDEAKAYLRGKRARSREGAVATAAALLAEMHDPPPEFEGLTLAQLNDTAHRLFRNGAPLALAAGPGY